jgi:hypothetical protein
MGVGPHLMPEDLARYIQNDHGLHPEDRARLLRLLETPDTGAYLLTGATGAGIALAVARWRGMSPASQTLMSLAGFGLGNIILNKLGTPGRHADWNAATGKNTIHL